MRYVGSIAPRWRMLISLALLLLNVGCDKSQNAPKGPWTSPPPGGQSVSDDELEALKKSGTLTPISPQQNKTDSATYEAKLKENIATVEAFLATHPELRERLIKTPAPGTVKVLPDGNYEVDAIDKVAGKKPVVLHGEAVRYATIAAALKRFNTQENQLKIYRALFPRVPTACQTDLPDPATSDAMTADQLKPLNRQMAQCLRTMADTFGPPNPTPPAGQITDPKNYDGAVSDPVDAYFGDQSGSNDCKIHETYCEPNGPWQEICYGGIWKETTWAGKPYGTEVKDQGRRGACTSFAIVGTLEQSIARNLGHWTNLSEQSLYAKGKLEWFPNGLKDGLVLVDTVERLYTTGWSVPFESIWPYNRSPSRQSCDGDGCETSKSDPEYYIDSCVDKGPEPPLPYTGPACGETSHQAKLVCNNGNCYYWVPGNPTQSGYGVDDFVELNDLEDGDSNLTLAFIQVGYSVAIGIDVNQSFMNISSSKDPQNGIYGGPYPDDAHVGSHALHVSGIVYNSQLKSWIQKGKGGGYLVIKNSWGHCWADAGYVYMTLYSASNLIHSAVALLSQRVGTNNAPTLKILEPTPSQHVPLGGLLNLTKLSATASDLEDGDNCCTVQWTSSLDGALGTGASLEVAFKTAGTHTITATAIDSEGAKTSASVTLFVDNGQPVAQIFSPSEGAKLIRGLPYVFVGNGTDPNEPSGFPCTSLTWLSSIPSDALHNKKGCQVETIFTTAGHRTVILSARDPQGLEGIFAIGLDVVDPAPQSPPSVSILSPFGTLNQPAIHKTAGDPLSLQATVKDPDGLPNCTQPGEQGCMLLNWTARETPSGTSTPLGTTEDLTFTPTSIFGQKCNPLTIELKLCATDPDGTTCTSTFVSLGYPPC